MIGNLIIYGVSLVLSFVYGTNTTYGDTQLRVEAVVISTSSYFLCIGYPLYGFALFRVLGKAAIASQRKSRMLKKVPIHQLKISKFFV